MELYNLGVFKGNKWWEQYEEEMFNRGLSYEECWDRFPLLLKFLLDLSTGNEGVEKFDPNAELSFLFDELLGYSNREEAGKNKQLKFLQCIFEMCGLALEPEKKFQKMYSLLGAGGDGKSVLLGLFDFVMNNTINGNLCGHTPIDELGDKFALQSLLNQVCNISDDTNDKVISNTGIIKTLIGAGGTGTGITVPRKNKDDYWWDNPQILLIIAGNKMPRFKDTTDGMLRRIIFLNFKNSLKKRGSMDFKLSEKLKLNPKNVWVLFNIGRVCVGSAERRGELTEMLESVSIKNRVSEEGKSDVQKFIDYIELTTGEPIEKYLLGEYYPESKLGGGTGMSELLIGKSGVPKQPKSVPEVYLAFMEFMGQRRCRR